MPLLLVESGVSRSYFVGSLIMSSEQIPLVVFLALRRVVVFLCRLIGARRYALDSVAKELHNDPYPTHQVLS